MTQNEGHPEPEWRRKYPTLRYFYNIGVALDQLLNVLLLGDPDETLSSRMGKWLLRGTGIRRAIGMILCSVLDIIDPGHCIDAIEVDEGEDAVIASNQGGEYV